MQVFRRLRNNTYFRAYFYTMKSNRHLVLTLIVFILLAAIYRVLPFRVPGFVPHLAMALFAGATIRDKKWAFAFPLVSIFISDVIYHLLYINGLTPIQGFYSGQFTNYLLFAAMTAVGFLIRRASVLNIALHSVTVSVAYFLVSNFLVWNNGGGYARPHTFEGLMLCYADALPFLQWNVISTLLFSAILFGGWHLVKNRQQPAIG